MKRYPLGLVGESKYQPAIRRTRVGEEIALEPEPANPYDSRAVRALNRRGDVIGYLPRDGWLTRVIVDEEKAIAATVKSIESGGGRSLGVVLDVVLLNASIDGAPVTAPAAPPAGSISPMWIAVGLVAIFVAYLVLS